MCKTVVRKRARVRNKELGREKGFRTRVGKGALGAVQELGRGQGLQFRSKEEGKGCSTRVRKEARGAVQKLGRRQWVHFRS